MNAQKIVKVSSKIYILFSILCVLYVGLFSMYSPQATMKLVSTVLPNNDAISSIRGVYGGVGLVIVVALIYLLRKDLRLGLIFITLFWISYALSRLITLVVDGPLGDFGFQWLIIESVQSILGLGLLLLFRLSKKI
ncbi:DUF4345 domain-containing protein [Sphingobacterium detergens]|uniref:Uncharacterized protein DUF4345 n=1 Tax=Sphingobacterium detergens TaxID=1145106 RepID=A0A420BH23_SPHD1|nr:DUF4345 domain-containing protein [Sphingobacterium detergens]RKE56000.1 uncharacterized protein DUF4345 [Sphingobacterium detergens]